MQEAKNVNRMRKDDLSIPVMGKTKIEVMRFESNAEAEAYRAAACQRARNYRANREAALKQASRKERIASLMAKFIGDLIIMTIVFALLGAALYFGGQ